MTVVSEIPAKRQRVDAGDGASVDGLKWDHDVNLIGEKVTDADLLNCCQICTIPILTYGRMIPCKHVFCYSCANKSPTLCAKCGDKVTRIEECALGTVFVCSFGAGRHAAGGCRRTYLSLRDMDAHIKLRHAKKEAPKPATQVSTAQVPNFSQPPPGVNTAPPTHIPPPSSEHNRMPQSMQLGMSAPPSMHQVSPMSNSNRMAIHNAGPIRSGIQGSVPGQMLQTGGIPISGQLPIRRTPMQAAPQIQRMPMVPGQQMTSTGQVMVQGGQLTQQPGQMVQQQGQMVQQGQLVQQQAQMVQQQQAQMVQQQGQMARRMTPVTVPPPGMPPVSMAQQMMPHPSSQHSNMSTRQQAPMMRMAGQPPMMPQVSRMPPPGNPRVRPPPSSAMTRPPIQQRPPGPRSTSQNNLISIPIQGASAEAQKNTFQRY